MNKLILIFLSITFSFSNLVAQIDIDVARGMIEGSTVTVEGIATNGAELGVIRYIQDATGAIPAYPGTGSAANFPESVERGDLVQITGVLKIYNGLLEIDPINSYSVISSGNPVPNPLEVTPNGVNEANEAKLLKINGVTFVDGGSVFTVGNYTFSVGGEMSDIYIRTTHPLIGTTIPLATVNLTGIASQFNSTYQLLPRDLDDLEIADNFYFTTSPSQSNISTSAYTVSWETNTAGSSSVRYGTTPSMDDEINDGGSTTDHSVTISGLDPAEIYYVQAFSNNGNTTINSTVKFFSTASNSTGTVRVYFNHDIDGSFSNGSYPINTTPGALEAAIINRINNATTSIDASIYNINRTPIVEALTNAYNNGVVVRYVTDNSTGNLALQNPTPPFPVIKGNIDGLMHNKFFIFDADSEDDSWVIMGSTNMTEQNLANDFNNTVSIQDQTLAKTYTREFEEMWGSEGPDPGIFNVKFGPDKTDNTPHLFNINGMSVESYFSPSDNTTIGIGNAITTANADLQFAMLTFTNNELGSAVLNAHNASINVRGIIDNINDQGSEYEYLLNNGVNVTPDNNTKQTHHKYCIIDATNPNSDPQIVTGSHNWSGSADTRNDENTLIFHDADLANIFLQEFEARWCEATGGSNCITSSKELNEIEGFEATIFPNPAMDHSFIKMELESQNDVVINVWDFNGRMLQSSILREVQGEVTEQLFLNNLPSGTYIVTFKVNEQISSRKLEIVK